MAPAGVRLGEAVRPRQGDLVSLRGDANPSLGCGRPILRGSAQDRWKAVRSARVARLQPLVAPADRAGGERRLGPPGRQHLGRSRPAGRGGHSPPGAGLRPRPAGHDRHPGRPGVGPLRRGGPALGAERQRLATPRPPVRDRGQAPLQWSEQEPADLDGGGPSGRARSSLSGRRCRAGCLGADRPWRERRARSCLSWASSTVSAPPGGSAWRPSTATAAPRAGSGSPGVAVLGSAAPSPGPAATPGIRAFSERRLAAGQPEMVALTACRHTLPALLNAITHARTPWRQPADARHPG